MYAVYDLIIIGAGPGGIALAAEACASGINQSQILVLEKGATHNSAILYNEILPEFQKHGAELLGISVDGVWCHGAFAKDRHLHFPLMADFEPKGAVARAYAAYREEEGTSERALFVIDKNGVIVWSYCSPVAVNPGADGILRALEELA